MMQKLCSARQQNQWDVLARRLRNPIVKGKEVEVRLPKTEEAKLKEVKS
jgi:hypothetical protein